MFQLLSENCIKDNKEFITRNNLLNCLQKINSEIDDEKLGKILTKYDLYKDFDNININDFIKILIF
jgi:Ca2+-binding EF-hand superfamily protein